MTTAADPVRDDLTMPDDGVLEAPAVLRIPWADPQHMAVGFVLALVWVPVDPA